MIITVVGWGGPQFVDQIAVIRSRAHSDSEML